MRYSPIEQKIANIVAPVFEETGLRLVRVLLASESGSPLLQILAENRETHNLGVDDCAMLSREIAALLDVEDPINGPYRLEVSSPGIDRPLVSREDYEDYAGFEAKIEIEPAINGQKRFKGRINGIDGENTILLDTETGRAELPLHDVRKAKLVLTDELINAFKARRKGNDQNGTAASS
jgi:ribosome maturation factor RimP